MPATPATRALRAAKIPFTEHVYDHDPSVTDYGQEAADALGVSADRVFKTLVVASEAGLAVVVVPVATMMDTKAVAAALGVKKVGLAESTDAQRSSGYVVGGISPFGQRRRLPTVLDQSATDYPSILVSGGRRGFDIEVDPQDLVRLLDALVAPVAR
ncbi:Cys-tRNA(Pro) deacylase [Branchiibius sp. NY16-3462-2]|uniref:Cys-tRNA(Pro) deacylase n=1 Tax=Branchiibius sp. NY16-3462-2 TaxID=1807500 RepID=UPI00079398F1|nr:Cys-tRNA(Pro) deacylase [Branchiibius sp. NY16-3462-2]KYH44485.1 aminoacyl-tRNA deacylase [Branchiibius sp. NY16-3462-2]